MFSSRTVTKGFPFQVSRSLFDFEQGTLKEKGGAGFTDPGYFRNMLPMLILFLNITSVQALLLSGLCPGWCRRLRVFQFTAAHHEKQYRDRHAAQEQGCDLSRH
jgi:hypothetical protein